MFGIVLVVMLLSLGSASGQVTPESVLPIQPSVTRHAEIQGPVLSGPAPQSDPPPGQPQTAPSQNSDRGFVSLLKRGARDQKEIYTAPLRPHNLKWDAIFLAATAGLIAADKRITGEISHNNLSTSQHISDVGLYSTTATTGLLLVSGIVKNDEHAEEAGLLGFEAFANTLAVSAITQLAAGRERPLEGVGHGRFWVNNALDSSFPSLHSGLTWSMASVLAREYPRPWVEILAYGTATTVSVTRVTGLKHFPADVAVGGVFGYFIGRQIFHSHSRFFHPRQLRHGFVSTRPETYARAQ